MPPSPIKSERFEKNSGCRKLFEEKEDSREIENIDTKWIIDII